jgi:uncharacterized protein
MNLCFDKPVNFNFPYHSKCLKMRPVLFILTFCVLVLSCKSQQQASLPINKNSNTLLWEVSGKGLTQRSYLFGTFHLMCRGDIVFSEALKTAVLNSKLLYMELDMDDPAVMMGGLAMLQMKDGKKIRDLYSEAEYKKISSFFKDSLGTPIDFLESVKPYFLIALMYPKLLPCKTVSGVEEELLKLAKTQKKEVRGLETMAFQSAVFDSIPYQQQAKELLKSIDSMGAYRHYFDTMVQVYKNQQLSRMQQLFNNDAFGLEDYQDILLDKRNANWVVQLKTIMKQQPVFVAVGAGHLVGDKGLIALLKKEGYTVKPVKND